MHHRPGFAAQSNSLFLSFFLFSFIFSFCLFLSIFPFYFPYLSPISLRIFTYSYKILFTINILFSPMLSTPFILPLLLFHYSIFPQKFTLSHSKIIYKFLANLLLKQHKKLFTALSSSQNLSQ